MLWQAGRPSTAAAAALQQAASNLRCRHCRSCMPQTSLSLYIYITHPAAPTFWRSRKRCCVARLRARRSSSLARRRPPRAAGASAATCCSASGSCRSPEPPPRPATGNSSGSAGSGGSGSAPPPPATGCSRSSCSGGKGPCRSAGGASNHRNPAKASPRSGGCPPSMDRGCSAKQSDGGDRESAAPIGRPGSRAEGATKVSRVGLLPLWLGLAGGSSYPVLRPQTARAAGHSCVASLHGTTSWLHGTVRLHGDMLATCA